MKNTSTAKETVGSEFSGILYGHWFSDDDGIPTYWRGEFNDRSVWFSHKKLSFGDYDDSCHVERANVKWFLENKDVEGSEFLYHFIGNYGHETILIHRDCSDPEILEILNALCQHSCISDDAVSHMEIEMVNTHINDMSGSDFESIVEDHFPDVEFSGIEEENVKFRQAFVSMTYSTAGETYNAEIQAGGSVHLPDLDEHQARQFLAYIMFGTE